MFRNQYDTDVTVWSPEGRLLQVKFMRFVRNSLGAPPTEYLTFFPSQL